MDARGAKASLRLASRAKLRGTSQKICSALQGRRTRLASNPHGPVQPSQGRGTAPAVPTAGAAWGLAPARSNGFHGGAVWRAAVPRSPPAPAVSDKCRAGFGRGQRRGRPCQSDRVIRAGDLVWGQFGCSSGRARAITPERRRLLDKRADDGTKHERTKRPQPANTRHQLHKQRGVRKGVRSPASLALTCSRSGQAKGRARHFMNYRRKAGRTTQSPLATHKTPVDTSSMARRTDTGTRM